MSSDAQALATKMQDVVRLMNTNNERYKNLVPGGVAVSTMTVTASLNVDRVCRDIAKTAAYFVEDECPLALVETTGRGRKRKRQSQFYNQVTLRYADTKSVKIFTNGRLHITGCKTMDQFLEVATAVCSMLDTVGVPTTDESDTVSITGFQVQMINFNFEVGCNVYLAALRDVYIAAGFVALYDPDLYPGLNIKLPLSNGREATVLVFKSGKVIISACKDPDEMAEAHSLFMTTLDDVVGADKKNR